MQKILWGITQHLHVHQPNCCLRKYFISKSKKCSFGWRHLFHKCSVTLCRSCVKSSETHCWWWQLRPSGELQRRSQSPELQLISLHFQHLLKHVKHKQKYNLWPEQHQGQCLLWPPDLSEAASGTVLQLSEEHSVLFFGWASCSCLNDSQDKCEDKAWTENSRTNSYRPSESLRTTAHPFIDTF